MPKKDKYHSKIERAYFSGNDKEFRHELQNYIGYITRKYFPGFKQSKDLYREMRDGFVVEIYGYLKGGHYENTLKRLTKEGKKLEFTSYLWTQLRGLLTMYFNKYNKRRKREFSLGSNDIGGSELSDAKLELELAMKKQPFIFEDTTEDLLDYILNLAEPKSGFKNIYQVKILLWTMFKEGLC